MTQSPQNNKTENSEPNLQSRFSKKSRYQIFEFQNIFPMIFFFFAIDKISEKLLQPTLQQQQGKKKPTLNFFQPPSPQLSTHWASSLVLLQPWEWMEPFDSDTCSSRRKRCLRCPINLVILIPILFLHAFTRSYNCQQAEQFAQQGAESSL